MFPWKIHWFIELVNRLQSKMKKSAADQAELPDL